MSTIESLACLWHAIASTFKTYSGKSGDTLIKRLPSTPTLLTHILPALGKAVDASLTSGIFILPENSFRAQKGRKTPTFLKEYFTRLYDKDGYLFSFADPELIHELRTLLFKFYKLEQAFTPQQVVEATQKFIETDDSVKVDFSTEQIDAIKETFRGLFPNNPFDIRPHHSNGATADGINNEMKLHTHRYIPKLHGVYGVNYSFNSLAHAKAARAAGQLSIANPPAKVTFVPKDSRGPRTICMEPHESMYFQKGKQVKIYDYIETPGHPAYGRINFTNQEINRHLAYLGSLDGSLATIDMKDASDLVSWPLIQAICDPEWLVALTATRSAFVTLPDGTIRELKKFAPMGSALCFPIEAMLFYSIARVVTRDVWVYGDDIIVPAEVATQVMSLLESYGLVCNRDKSLTTGFFRESCGGDFFRGHNITPIRFKKLDYISVIAYANNMAATFSEEAGLAVIEWYESLNHTIILRLSNDNKDYCPLIAFYGSRDNSILFKRRYNSDLQRYEIRSLVNMMKPTKPSSYARPDVYEYDDFFYWLTNAETSSSPLERDEIHEILCDVNPYQNYKPGFLGSSSSRVKLGKAKLCHSWATYVVS